jgi:3-methyladenine DNA glycosylase AlkD
VVSPVADARDFAQEALRRAADPHKAAGMQAYMRTDMPFYGVQKLGRVEILRELVTRFPVTDRESYQKMVLGLWDLSHREEKYLALGVARHFREHVTPVSLPLFRRLIFEGAWWDFVDEIATKLIRQLVVAHPGQTWPVVDMWIDDEDMWLRRSAILCQIGAKGDTDPDRLFGFCERRAFEGEFFIRKAIGWALREYAKTDPEAVAAFLAAHHDRLSTLSYREASKHLGHLPG